VVGAGHNGLTCAALLARAGLDVLELERAEEPGGAAATQELALELDLIELPPRLAVLPDGRRVRETEEALRELLGPAEVERWRRWQEDWLAVARVVDRLTLAPPPTPDDLRRAARADGAILENL
jgi:phytoene dehydrogenase-like protein